ncbi:MAG: hypothetical protein ACM3SY_09130 [Candidatus Omnitrophota bacterium]
MENIEKKEEPLPGDVAAYQLSGGNDFSGHAGIMIFNKGKITNISAHENVVSTSPGQFENRDETIYRRYTGD